MNSINQTIKNTIASTFDMPLEMVGDDSSSQSIEKWDSIGHITLIMALEQELGLRFTVDEIEQLKDVAAIYKVVAAKNTEAKIP